ncbi:MAG TPA: LPS export ABC transporter periplasmic protein LptC [Arachidicoccus soli]|uniref:LPS export ABC transporter periplasmic protein LptC n=1 Tax=Arachidicoccus soli TaxID=2341117 RepID=A0A386HSU2_9BACT|nr:LPS export ABC transporter periplasmic protein LptC [Arachidicoccus soli]AYD48531.1 LPS export ABC transporter periplasmic protein LptC [Arachidicoccus soli]HEU0227663.1 LPS export ABC transporter periplasmic protein LptC [Arachidicoccus soli]
MTTFSKNIFKAACYFLAGCFFLLSCENDINEVKALNNRGINTEEATDIESYLSVGGKIKGKLTAPLMISTEKDTTSMTFPKSLNVSFFDSTGLPTSFVYAKYGIYYKSLRKVLLKDSVIATTIQGDTLTTSELWWDQNTQEIYSDKPSLLKQADHSVIPGQGGFHAKQDFSEFIFNNTNNGIIKQDSTMTM